MADFGEILRNIGEFGLFQQINLIALCFPNIIKSFALASLLFVESDPERHCNTDWILSVDPNLTTEEQLNLTLPREEDGSFSKCRMFVPVDWNIDAIRKNGLNQTETSECLNGWVYGNMLYETTIVTDFDLVCGRGYMLQVLQTVFMAGMVLGFLVFGFTAESFGRKRACQITAVMLLVFTVTTALCPNVYLYLVSQFFVGVAYGGYRVNCIVLKRHCNTDWILSAGPSLTTEEQLNLTLPREEDGSFSRCRMFVPVDWDIHAIRKKGLNETSECLNGWVYGNMLYESTIVTDFDLVCGRGNMLRILQTVFMVGMVLGFLIFGPAAESFGRKRATQIPAVMLAVFTVTTALCPNVYLYSVSQFLVGVAAGGYRVNCIVLTTEWIGASKRSWGVGVTQLFGSIGQCILAGLIFGVRKWRLTQLISATPLVLTILYIWFIPESARWLLNRGRREEAKKLIVKAAAINKRPIPDSLLEEIKVTNSVNEGGIKLIFGSRLLARYFFVVSLAWFSLNLTIFSLYFDMANLGLSIFVTQLLFGAFEVPALLLSMWLLEILGRKILFITVLLTGGLCSMMILAVPESYAIVSTCLAVASRVCMIFMASVCAVYMQELFPTSVRQSATALGSMAGRVGSILAPLLNMLFVYHWAIPVSVLSSFTIISGVLGFLLPETKNKELPETASDAKGNRYASNKEANLGQLLTPLSKP